MKILTIAVFIAACGVDKPAPDISGIDLSIEIKRLEIELFNIQEKQISAGQMKRLHEDFGDFFKLFVERIVAVGAFDDSTTAYYLSHFKNDPQVEEIARAAMEKFPEMELLNHDFSDAFKRYKVFFPNNLIPEIYTYVSAFSFTVVVSDSLLGIGLDMYLGSDNNYYKRLAIPAYRVRNMSREYILADCLKSWLSTEYVYEPVNDDLLSNMIYHGKLLYALDLLIPEADDSIKIGYSGADLKWVNQSEKEMWFHFADRELFYNKEPKQIQKYIGEGPFTPGFPDGSPGMAGRWVGWQIVRKYMENNDPLALKALFEENDAARILKLSKYKPQ